ncbi:MAG: response regulator transcription factor [Gaiellaceae bacterium]|jgi:DNA-binding response OmpR family regulator
MSNALHIDEPDAFLTRHLTSDGFRVVDDESPDLALLRDATAVADFRSRFGNVPVIVLGGPESDTVDRVRAFERGCDDFLARPFEYQELVARIRAILRRTAAVEHDVLVAGPIRVDAATRTVTVEAEIVQLAGKEYELLLKLMSDERRVFTKDQLLRDVWGFRSLGRTRTLDSHASRLRRKLQSHGAGPFVLNVWGVGYRLLPDVTSSGA